MEFHQICLVKSDVCDNSLTPKQRLDHREKGIPWITVFSMLLQNDLLLHAAANDGALKELGLFDVLRTSDLLLSTLASSHKDSKSPCCQRRMRGNYISFTT